MKNNYIGNIIIAFALGTLVFFAGAHACQSFPFLAKWVGGECWFDSSKSDMNYASAASAKSMAQAAEGYYLKAKALQGGRSDDEIVKAAIYALANSGSDDAVDTLKNIALTHKSADIRKTALYALAQCAESEELLTFYQELAEHGNMLPVRKAAIHSIGQVGNQDAIKILVDFATSPHHVSLRKAAVHALQNCDSELAQKALYNILAKVVE